MISDIKNRQDLSCRMPKVLPPERRLLFPENLCAEGPPCRVRIFRFGTFFRPTRITGRTMMSADVFFSVVSWPLQTRTGRSYKVILLE